jgi:hypothetical protein
MPRRTQCTNRAIAKAKLHATAIVIRTCQRVVDSRCFSRCFSRCLSRCSRTGRWEDGQLRLLAGCWGLVRAAAEYLKFLRIGGFSSGLFLLSNLRSHLRPSVQLPLATNRPGSSIRLDLACSSHHISEGGCWKALERWREAVCRASRCGSERRLVHRSGRLGL